MKCGSFPRGSGGRYRLERQAPKGGRGFHFIPAVAETTTRLPAGAPLFPDVDAPGIQAITAVLFAVFLVGAAFQVRRLRASLSPASGSARQSLDAAYNR